MDLCLGCDRALCDEHARALPPVPSGISANALGRFELATRRAGPHCEDCRAELGSEALAQAIGAPRAVLPDHWLDRALALSGDQTRSELEKLADADLPPTLTPAQAAAEFLRRVEQPPRERVPVSPSTVRRTAHFAEGWSVDCRRTEYSAKGSDDARYPLPCLLTTRGELIGPTLDADDGPSQTWSAVPDADVELVRLVRSIAQILVLSAFTPGESRHLRDV